MGRRYFCDYCDRSFQDNLHNRKKHLNGVQHQRSKKVWYDLFRDASEILAEEGSKKLCRRFLQRGQCDFGNSCRFSHMTAEDVEALKARVEVPLHQSVLSIIYHQDGLHYVIYPHHSTPPHLQRWVTQETLNGANSEDP
ncbi:zinc finger matrin-type protein 5 isoform X2 [Hyla sarda]|uniref:zinc finger matrin-type protein 5 isoform X2 n=1 Tax=Hyla sarda TaxID=327740 RepID=UPI0024C38952|nr:zinc finger matrin-type protein 5 isoform X2 [Hyla sarda]